MLSLVHFFFLGDLRRRHVVAAVERRQWWPLVAARVRPCRRRRRVGREWRQRRPLVAWVRPCRRRR
uniref:Uncharacterized protein n=1 Tax=Oryza brachyantha TaxID=4533 RepID=J3N693_ORYBR